MNKTRKLNSMEISLKLIQLTNIKLLKGTAEAEAAAVVVGEKRKSLI